MFAVFRRSAGVISWIMSDSEQRTNAHAYGDIVAVGTDSTAPSDNDSNSNNGNSIESSDESDSENDGGGGGDDDAGDSGDSDGTNPDNRATTKDAGGGQQDVALPEAGHWPTEMEFSYIKQAFHYMST